MQAGSGEVRVLGFQFSSAPTVGAHIKAIEKRVRKRIWLLRNLKRCNFTKMDLVAVYLSHIRPVIESNVVIYHPMITNDQSIRLERLQQQYLKIVWGYTESYSKLLKKSGMNRLDERREGLCDKFAVKSLKGKYGRWFPRRATSRARVTRPFLEEMARCDRLKNSPIYYYRKRLN